MLRRTIFFFDKNWKNSFLKKQQKISIFFFEFLTKKSKIRRSLLLNPHLHEMSYPPTCTRVFQNTYIVRERTDKTNERPTVVDTNSVTSRGLLTQKKRFRAQKKSFWPSSGQKLTFQNAHLEHLLRFWAYKIHLQIFQNKGSCHNKICYLLDQYLVPVLF